MTAVLYGEARVATRERHERPGITVAAPFVGGVLVQHGCRQRAKRLGGGRDQELLAVHEVMIRRGLADADGARDAAQRDAVRARLLGELDRRAHQRRAQIAVVVGGTLRQSRQAVDILTTLGYEVQWRFVMSAELVFQICTFGAVPAWLMLLLAPRWRLTDLVVQRVWIPAMLALFYLWAQAADPIAPPAEAGFHSLAAITALFSSPHALLAGWIHFIALDLFAGAWMVRDAQRLKLGHGWVAPCLVVTFALAPVGLLAWFTIRAIKRRDVAFG